MIKIKLSDIEDELTVCPYCMEPRSMEYMGCCGESRCHFEKAYQVKEELSNSYLLASEVEVDNEN